MQSFYDIIYCFFIFLYWLLIQHQLQDFQIIVSCPFSLPCFSFSVTLFWSGAIYFVFHRFFLISLGFSHFWFNFYLKFAQWFSMSCLCHWTYLIQWQKCSLCHVCLICIFWLLLSCIKSCTTSVSDWWWDVMVASIDLLNFQLIATLFYALHLFILCNGPLSLCSSDSVDPQHYLSVLGFVSIGLGTILLQCGKRF